MRKGFAQLLLLIPLFVLIAATAIFFYYTQSKSSKSQIYNVVIQSPSASAKSIDPNQSGLAVYPDKPIDFDISSTISVNTLITHRSALNEKVVVVHGFVIEAKTGYIPSGGLGIAATPPTITLSDSINNLKDSQNNLQIILTNNQTNYTVGQKLTLKGVVFGDKWSVSLHSNLL